MSNEKKSAQPSDADFKKHQDAVVAFSKKVLDVFENQELTQAVVLDTLLNAYLNTAVRLGKARYCSFALAQAAGDLLSHDTPEPGASHALH